MTFVDTNVVLDIFDRDPIWFPWSAARFTEASAGGPACIDVIVVAELSRSFDDLAALRSKLERLALLTEPLDAMSAFVAGKRFQAFRRLREAREDARVLPDFLIGAHALTLDRPLLTRDPRLYRRYFPELSLITPETHP